MAAELSIVLVVGLGTLAMRASMVTVLSETTIPPWLEEALSLVAPAILAGLVAQTLFLDQGQPRPLGPWYPAALVAAVVAWRFRSFGWTLAAGMASVWVFGLLS